MADKKKRKTPVRNLDGKPIINSDESLTLAVRTADIRHAVATAPDACAAAIACVRQFHALSARVYASRTFIEYETHWMRYVTSPPLRREIVALDDGEKFHPGLYRLGKADAPGNAATGSGTGGPLTERYKPSGKTRKKPIHIHTLRGRVHFASSYSSDDVTTADLLERK